MALSYRRTIWEPADLTQKNTWRGGLRALPNMSKLWISLKPLALAQNSNKNKKFDLSTCHDSGIAYYMMLALLIVNLFKLLLASNANCSGKKMFLKFKYSQMITWKQAQSLEKYPCYSSYLIANKTKMKNLLKVTRYKKVHNRCNQTLHLNK